MSTPVSVRPAAARRPISWPAAVTATLLVPMLLAGCAETPPPLYATAADANVRVAPVNYRPVLETYNGARPIEPAPWTGAANKGESQ